MNKIKQLRKGRVFLTWRGLATYAAIKSGLLHKVKDGWDNGAFEKFLNLFEELLDERLEDKYRKNN